MAKICDNCACYEVCVYANPNRTIDCTLWKPCMEWIPVSERLPFAEYGESDDVLTVSEFGVMRVLNFDGGCWCYLTGECCPHKITHWMPLPEPPKEDESDA